MIGIELFFALMIGHAIADFWAQSDAVAKMKNRNRDSSQFCPPGQKPQMIWPYALTSHALIHAGVVWVITGVVWFAVFELVAHWLIDFGKCDNLYGIHEDQAMHVACKIGYCLV